jgi:tetratricopeptide (TPR) repeat protein
MRARSIAVALALAAWSACGSPGPVVIPVTSTPYDALETKQLDDFRAARAAFEGHDYQAARDTFERLFAEDPQNICIGTWLEECEFALGDAPDAIAARWAERARAAPTVANEVLAARVAVDPDARAAALARAEALDPRCAWIHNARAFDAAAVADWPAARKHLAAAKDADPGNLWTHWLAAWVATRTERLAEVASALEGFIEAAEDDPRIPRTLLDTARLDLALVWTLDDEPRDASELLEAVDPNGPDAARRLEALAQIRQALGDLKGALVAAEEAEKIAPGEILPVVQQAVLFEEWMHDEVRAEAAWRRALEMARASTKLGSVLERTRAGIRLERFAAEREKKARP